MHYADKMSQPSKEGIKKAQIYNLGEDWRRKNKSPLSLAKNLRYYLKKTNFVKWVIMGIVRIESMIVGNFISTRKLISAAKNSTLKEVHQIMAGNEISHIPLLNASGFVAGVLGEREVRSFYLATNFDSILAKTVMTKDFLSFPPDALLSVVTAKMVAEKQCVVVITGPDDKPLGVFTVSDALAALNAVLNKKT